MNVTIPNDTNTGLRDRAAWLGSSIEKTFIGRPHFDLFHPDKLIPANVDLKFRFIPNKSSWLLKTAAPAGTDRQVAYKIDILSARMYIHTKQISPSLLVAHEKMLQKSNYRIPYNKVTTKTISLANGLSVYEQDNIYMGQLPDLIVVAFVADNDMGGGYQRNPFNFQNFGINYFAIKANGEQIPRVAHQPNFEKGDYIRSYIAVLEALGYDIGPNCWDLTPEEWANGYNIYAFKVTPGPIGSIHSPSKTGGIRLEIKFTKATASNITMILLSQHQAELQIDRHKNIISIQ